MTELQVSLAHRVCLDQQVPVENPEAEELRASTELLEHSVLGVLQEMLERQDQEANPDQLGLKEKGVNQDSRDLKVNAVTQA